MMNLLKSLYLKIEELKGRKLAVTLLLVFISFTIVGIVGGYFINGSLNKNEVPVGGNEVVIASKEKRYYEGRITYVNPEMYPLANVSYTLNDPSGKVVILLRAKDQKLSIAENLNVKVGGTLSKLENGTEVLDVTEVIIRNVTN